MDSFFRVKEKVLSGERLTESDAVTLFETPYIYELGALADQANLQKNHKSVFYNLNSHLNPTNICVMSCKFCSFARKPGDEGAFAYSLEEIVSKAEVAARNGAKEIHMVGGLHPRWKLDYYADMFRSIKERFPSVHIKALTAVEIDWLSRKSRKSHEETLLFLKEAGLDSLPGGGAEIFHPDCRELITAKLSTENWLAIHRTAHGLGLKSNCTMLYGHVETYIHRAYHLQKLRELQDETNGFNCFIPLAFQPHNNEMGISRYTYGVDDLKTIAVARLFLDNFKSIKAFWVMLGQDIAQVALHFGANDCDGTVLDEKISLMAGGRSGAGMMQKDIKQLIVKAQRYPQERDTIYNIIGSQLSKQLDPAVKPRDDNGEDECPDTVTYLLNQAAEAKELSSDELLRVAKTSDFVTLTLVADHVKKRLNGAVVTYCPGKVFDVSTLLDGSVGSPAVARSLVFDVAGFANLQGHSVSLEKLLALVARYRGPGMSLGLAGFCGLWALAQAESLPLGELFKRLARGGISVILPSSQENESGLTNSEMMNLHRLAHSKGIQTVAKVEICCPLTDPAPLWKPFFDRLLAFRELQKTSPGILAFAIEPAHESWVTAYEVLQAVALGRIALQGVQHLICPVAALPTSQERTKAEAGTFLKGQEKYAPLALVGGADDWGMVPPDSVAVIGEEIASVKLEARQRDLLFQMPVIKSEGKQAGELTHEPYP
ncbi:MAG: aminofutalosine synthase MqnE [Deltaproteobacteria bacterium]|nr:aminofutalosine synthase MqnE [Deltaproteobacteria bacterium]